jgi:hypothetical protein
MNIVELLQFVSEHLPPDVELTEEQLGELAELTSFIDAHGGKLGPFRGWRPSVEDDE